LREKLLVEAEGQTTSDVIEILGNLVNDLQGIGDEAATGKMAPEEEGGPNPTAQESIATDAGAANDILVKLLDKLESGNL